VAGLVLVESGVDNPWRNFNGQFVRIAEAATGRSVPPVKTSGPLRESDIPPAALGQIRAAAAELGPTANEPPRDRLPADAQRMRTWALSQVKHYAANDSPFEGEELSAMIGARKDVAFPLGDRPLVVITSHQAPLDNDPRSIESDRRAQQAALARMSQRGRQVITTRSGHHIQIEEPELVIGAIREVLAATKR
jgi:pimeloyl-ACP methyl ester carboxylesterase